MSFDGLNEQEYSETFLSFLRVTPEKEVMCALTNPILDSFNQKRLHLMSIGPGTGCFENSMIRDYGMSLEYFYGIEPSPELLKELEGVVTNWNVKYFIDKTYFTPEYDIKERFDLIFMAHCLYAMPNVVDIICHAKSFLKPNGKLLIFNQSVTGSCEVHRKLLSIAPLGKPGVNINESVSMEDVCSLLQEKGVTFYIREKTSHIDLSDFIAKRDNNVVSFMVHTIYEKLPHSIQSEIYDFVKDRCTNPEPGKYLLPHPAMMMVIEQK